MEIILLVGLVALFAVQHGHKRRVDQVTRELELLRQSLRSSEASTRAEPFAAEPERHRIAGGAPPRPRGSEGGGLAPSPAVRDTFATLFERFVAGRLLIWIGGISLAVAGAFLVRYSIEVGLVTPELRMIGAAAFGAALLALGEGARASRLIADDPRVSQALVGAGLAVLYATVYGSYLLFGFLGATAASALMVAITLGALALALRHGAGTAVLGLVGGELTPWLVGDADAGALPLLAYLALLNAAVFAIAWRRRWGWLAGLAVLASLVWTGFLLTREPADAIAGGFFALGLGILAESLKPRGPALWWFQPMAIAGIEAAMLTAREDVGPVGWLAFGGIAGASVVLARVRGEEPYVPLLILLLGLLLLPLQSWLGGGWLSIATVGMTLVFGLAGLVLALERRTLAWTLLASLGCAAPLVALRWSSPALAADSTWGVLQALAAAGPFTLAIAGRSGTALDLRRLSPALTGTGLLAVAAFDLAPGDGVSIAWLALSVILIAIGMATRDRALRLVGLILLTLTVLKLFLIDAAALEGILRILSFLGLGIALIGVGKLYAKVLLAEAKPAE